MKKATLKIVPGLYKIFDEILVNAADNKIRCPSMTYIKVVIDPEKNLISVENDGEGIPIEIHKEHNIWVPSLIFGELLTGSSFKDDEEKVTGGRNGYGAKLANIYSTKFELETIDSKMGKKFVQVWENNMKKKGEPKITSCSRKKEYTKITFYPDLERFRMEKLDNDIVKFMTRRVFDIAATTEGVKVHLNDEKIPVKSFKDYVKLYTQGKKVVYEKINDRWEFAVCDSEGDGLEQVSFVNSIYTGEGGKHIDYILAKLSKGITDYATKKHKGITIKPGHIRQHISIFLKCLIVNASFSSQTKDKLTTQQKNFGSKCDIDDEVMKKICTKTDIVTKIAEYSKYKQNAKLKNTLSAGKKKRVTGIQKLEDANDAGGRNAHKCTLILTEGDSAKALAISGLSVVGRDHYGVFPLKGKLLNVRKKNMEAVNKNEEISNIVKIMGLKFNKEYTEEEIKTLRYGSIMIMADQDHDGSHIKGLLINFLHLYWPSLLKINGFLKEFITPIVKVRHNRDKKRIVSFYTIPEYERWKEANNEGRGWTIKYYKGLGTSTAKEAKEYFSDLGKHVISFRYDATEADQKIKMAFSTDADARKDWINNYEEGTFIDHKECVRTKLAFNDFIDKELVLFSIADTQRSIPSLVDGFKPSQRKILYSCFKRNLKNEIKVAQLCGYVSEHSAYHHGEQSLSGAIIGMAQNFVGSNNINVLVPNGQFGTRLQGGKDHASARYIFTSLSEITRFIFRKEDDNILKYLDDDGQMIEPRFYIPIIPMILVNGCEGIGTGYSSKVPNFNPLDIISNLRRILNDEAPIDMTPWYKRFIGNVSFKKLHTFESQGVIQEIEENVFYISELPIKLWTETYKEMLEKYEEDNQIDEFRQNHTDTTVSFTVYVSPSQRAEIEKKGMDNFFKLSSLIHTSNMTLFDKNDKLKRYEHVLDILKEFYEIRIEAYKERKNYMLAFLRRELLILDNRVRFIRANISGEIVLKNKKKAEIMKQLREMKFDPYPESLKKKTDKTVIENQSEAGISNEEESPDDEKPYDYLLSMPLWSLTWERVKKLEEDKEQKKKEVSDLIKLSPKELWLSDLKELEDKYNEVMEKEERELEKQLKKHHNKNKGKKLIPRKKPVKKEKNETENITETKTIIDLEETKDKPKTKRNTVLKKKNKTESKKDSKSELIPETKQQETKQDTILDISSDEEIVPLKIKSQTSLEFLDKPDTKPPAPKRRRVDSSMESSKPAEKKVSSKKISEYFSPKKTERVKRTQTKKSYKMDDSDDEQSLDTYDIDASFNFQEEDDMIDE